MQEKPTPEHFHGREAISHVAEVQAQGIVTSTEIHGAEMPGHLAAGADSAREAAVYLSLFVLALSFFGIQTHSIILASCLISVSLIFWKGARAAWLGWFLLERLNRIVAQEKWEIEHHRGQEKDELKALYRAKGFEGKLLDDVVDVLMADNDRLLRVMVEEELRLSLESHVHPLKQGLGGALGTFLSAAICLLCYYMYPPYGLFAGALFSIAISSGIAAKYEQNKIVPAIIWNLGIAIATFGVFYFSLEYLK